MAPENAADRGAAIYNSKEVGGIRYQLLVDPGRADFDRLMMQANQYLQLIGLRIGQAALQPIQLRLTQMAADFTGYLGIEQHYLPVAGVDDPHQGALMSQLFDHGAALIVVAHQPNAIVCQLCKVVARAPVCTAAAMIRNIAGSQYQINLLAFALYQSQYMLQCEIGIQAQQRAALTVIEVRIGDLHHAQHR